jgi:dihydrofolate reductase
MGKLAVYEFIALDGVYEDPSWTMEFGFDPQMGATIGAGTAGAEAILLGRRTYEMFFPAWSTRTADEDPGAPFFNDTPKYVVSSTLTDPEWNNTSVLGDYDPANIRELKEATAGDIYCTGSGTLVRALLADALLDELHLFVFPTARGAGAHLFGPDDPATKLALLATDVYDNGVIHLGYGPAA